MKAAGKEMNLDALRTSSDSHNFVPRAQRPQGQDEAQDDCFQDTV